MLIQSIQDYGLHFITNNMLPFKMHHTPTLKPIKISTQSHKLPTHHSPQVQSHVTNQYRGITLKEYFQLGETSNRPMAPIQEDVGEHREEPPPTPQWPTINPPLHPINHRTEAGEEQTNVKLKTQQQQSTNFNQQSKKPLNSRSFNKIILSFDAESKRKRQGQRSKRTVTEASKNSMTKTSMGGFYYVHSKREKMLSKVRAERERVHSMRLNQAMLVSKYASKFHINVKDIIK